MATKRQPKTKQNQALQLVAKPVRKMSIFLWTAEKSTVALLLAEGYTYKYAAAQIGKTEKTIYRWTQDMEFSAEVDRLSLMSGIASKAERLRIVKRIVRKKVEAEVSDKDVLDWLKFAQSETDGVKLDLASLFPAVRQDVPSVADSGSSRDGKIKTG